MNDHNHDDEDILLTCDVCMKEIPASVAHSLEGPDYVQHFCGNECFEKWNKQQSPEQKPEPKP